MWVHILQLSEALLMTIIESTPKLLQGYSATFDFMITFLRGAVRVIKRILITQYITPHEETERHL